jgi:DNA-directed RNA polymerase subunit RPC12/RpoP
MGVVVIIVNNKLIKCDKCNSTDIVKTREGYVCRACGLILELKTESFMVSNNANRVIKKYDKSINQFDRSESVKQWNLFILKTQITKLLKTQGKTTEEIDPILKEMNDDLEKLLAFRIKLEEETR